MTAMVMSHRGVGSSAMAFLLKQGALMANFGGGPVLCPFCRQMVPLTPTEREDRWRAMNHLGADDRWPCPGGGMWFGLVRRDETRTVSSEE